jgi:hypothetical protein
MTTITAFEGTIEAFSPRPTVQLLIITAGNTKYAFIGPSFGDQPITGIEVADTLPMSVAARLMTGEWCEPGELQ